MWKFDDVTASSAPQFGHCSSMDLLRRPISRTLARSREDGCHAWLPLHVGPLCLLRCATSEDIMWRCGNRCQPAGGRVGRAAGDHTDHHSPVNSAHFAQHLALAATRSHQPLLADLSCCCCSDPIDPDCGPRIKHC